MAVDMFLKLQGIDGESRDSKKKDWVEVLAWSWGVSQSGFAGHGGGATAGKVNVQDLHLTKYVDKASPQLMLHCCNGKHIAKAELVVRKASEKPLEYIKIELTDLIVSSVSTGGSGGEDRLTENLSLNFSKVKVEYTEQTEKGGEGAKPKMGWDVKKNESF